MAPPQSTRDSQDHNTSSTKSNNSNNNKNNHQSSPSRNSNSNSERNMYEQELYKVREEVKFFKDQTLRLNNELRVFQIQYPYHKTANNSNNNSNRNGEDDDDNEEDVLTQLPPWMSQNILSPLISAYTHRISELNLVTETQRLNLIKFTGEAEVLITENELLRENQLGDIKSAILDGNHGNGGGGVFNNESSYNNQEFSDQSERLDILLDENSLLSEQTSILTLELDRANEEMRGKDDDIVNLTSTLTSAADTISNLESDITTLKENISHCETAIFQKTTHANTQVNEIKTLKSLIDGANREKGDAFSLIDDLRGEKIELTNECDSLSSKVSLSSTRINELNGKLSSKTLECDNLSNKLRRTTTELNTTRSDAEGMLTVLTGMESQLTEFQNRESGVSVLSRECKTKVEDCLLARDQSVAICGSLRREIGKLLEERKREAEEKGSAHDAVLEAIRGKMQGAIDGKEREIHDLTLANAKLKAGMSRSSRELLQSNETYGKLKNMQDSERQVLKNKFVDMTRRVNEAESKLEIEVESLKHCQNTIKSLQDDVEGKDKKVDQIVRKCEVDKNEYEKQIEDYNVIIRDLNEKVNVKKFEIDKLLLVADETKLTVHSSLNSSIQTLNTELDDMKIQLESARALSRDVNNTLLSNTENNSRHIDKLRGDKDKIVEQLEKKLSEERDVSQRMTNRNQELAQRVNMLAAEKSELTIILSEFDTKTDETSAMVTERDVVISELRREVGKIMEEVRGRVGEEGRLKGEVRRLVGEVKRLSS